MESVSPILVVNLFPELRQHLSVLLDRLTPQEWLLPTAAGNWNVKDIALHLLGGDIGILSRRRDLHTLPGPAISTSEDLIGYINCLNASWVEATRRMSCRVLCDLLAFTGPQVEAYFTSLNPFVVGDAVSWAGPEPAPVWFDLAREYTERWHHQQQIRDATRQPGLYDSCLFAPVLDAFVRALPHTFRNVRGSDEVEVGLTISGRLRADWVVRRDASVWKLFAGASANPTAHVTLAAEDAWKIFTRAIRGEQALKCAQISGDRILGSKVLEMVSVIA